MQVSPLNIEKFDKVYDEILEFVIADLKILYEKSGGIVEWYEWSIVLQCSTCGKNNLIVEAEKISSGK